MFKLHFDNTINGMKVVLINNSNMSARIGATGTIVKERCTEHYLYIEWDTDKYRYIDDEDFIKNSDSISTYLGQFDGHYRYYRFTSINSPEGQEMLKKVGKITIVITKDDIYCSCSSPNIVESFTGIMNVGEKFFYCKNCKKEKIEND